MKKNYGEWFEKISRLLEPKEIYLCDGSEKERAALIKKMLESGELIALNEAAYPDSFLHRSNPNDVARTEHLTFISSRAKRDAGPTNNWMDPAEAKAAAGALLSRAMRGRTMYAIPYLMGPVGSPYARGGIMVTDAPYVALSMPMMTRVTPEVYKMDQEKIVFGVHALHECDPAKRMVLHFPEENLIWSVGSGYGGNALLGKKCHGLRLATVQGRKEGWLAEHMLIIGVEDPEGRITYLAAAFPSACGKTNLAMLRSTLPGWRVWTVSDDLCWMHPGPDGRLWAINPERGFFAVAAGTGAHTNPSMLETIQRGRTIFTNVGMTPKGVPWWEGFSQRPPIPVFDWQGRKWKPELGPVSHPNARFTVAASQCPSISPAWEDPQGVPLSVILFGGRDRDTNPLVSEARTWDEGVYFGATLSSETTAAAAGVTGIIRNDPMAMRPFCGYNMADYFTHWIEMGSRLKNPPKVFRVNWFRRDAEGNFLWPGFGENIRVLKWVVERVRGDVEARESAIGLLPRRAEDIETDGLVLPRENLKALFRIDRARWQEKMNAVTEFFSRFGDDLSSRHPLRRIHEKLKQEMNVSK